MHIPRVGFRGLYLATLLGWLALSIVSLAIVGAQSKARFDQEFERHASASFHELRNKIRANEVAISSFASFISAVEPDNSDAIAEFAATMKSNYPHIYMFEVVRKVARHERAAFESFMQQRVDPEFRIRNFVYDESRQWASVRDKALYFPLIFMWPEVPAAKSIFGLDMDSIPHLQQAALAADAIHQSVSSKPFRLVEGDLAYVIFRSIKERNAQQSGKPMQLFSGPLQALLVIRAEDLVPAQQQAASSYRIAINGTGQNSPLLLDLASHAQERLGEFRWLPKAALSFEENSSVQPFKLTIERQMLWSDINVVALRWTGVLSLVTLLGLLIYLRCHYQRLVNSNFHASETEFLALHDPLTRLPNRQLFDDRLKYFLSNWRRRNESFGLMFIDLDYFKEINDRHGHKLGDLVLIKVAQRIRRCMRETDTVARIGGDEFVVLIGQVNSQKDMLLKARQMLARLARPMLIEGVNIDISASIGVSVCPEDGTDALKLIHRADMSMYAVKQRGRNGVIAGSFGPLSIAHANEYQRRRAQ